MKSAFRILIVCLSLLPSGFSTKADASDSSRILAEKSSADDRVHARWTVSPAEPKLSDTIFLTLAVRADETVDVDLPEFGDALGELTVVEITEKIEKAEDRSETKTLRIKAVPNRGGITPLWPIVVFYKDRREGLREQVYSIELPATELDVKADVSLENASLDNIPTTREVLDVPSGISHWIVVLILAALIALFFILRRRRGGPEALPEFSAREIAMKRLAALFEQRLHEVDVKQFYMELTGIVRWYIEQQTQIRAPELTTEEFLREISLHWNNRTGLAPELRDRLRLFLESSDMVKFAKHRPSSEDVLLGFRRAGEFIAAFAPPDEIETETP